MLASLHVKLVDIMLTSDECLFTRLPLKKTLKPWAGFIPSHPGFCIPQLCGQLHKQMGLPLTLSPVMDNFIVTGGGQSQHVHGPARELAV
jgi:hypothetical protein